MRKSSDKNHHLVHTWLCIFFTSVLKAYVSKPEEESDLLKIETEAALCTDAVYSNHTAEVLRYSLS